MTQTTSLPARAPADFGVFLETYKETLRHVFGTHTDTARLYLKRGLPPSLMRSVLACKPLSVFIPEAYGGRGEKVHECLSVLEASSYESLAMSLTVGINGALFLQPVSKYAREEIKAPIFERFVNHQNMGGLMITEPLYGSDALSMQTAYSDDGQGYRIEGLKHWAGLTGMADYWLMTARPRNESGNLGRDIDFFVLDTHQAAQAPEVEELYENLGLYMIPYGRNRVDVRVPKAQRLEPHSTGLKMMLDILHRSRVQFPGMGMGFLRRMLDEGLAHTQARQVGGKSLFSYDQVQARLARLQALFTACSAMCAFTSERAGLDQDLSKDAIPANAIKATLTDFMQEAAQSALQLQGAQAYRLDNIAGRGTMDSRPFQIFEGANDILYHQLADAVLKLMRRDKEENLFRYLQGFEFGTRASDYLKGVTDFTIDLKMPQRQLVSFGQVLGRIVTMELVIDLGERGFRQDLVDGALEIFQHEVATLMTNLRAAAPTNVIEDYREGGAWLKLVKP